MAAMYKFGPADYPPECTSAPLRSRRRQELVITARLPVALTAMRTRLGRQRLAGLARFPPLAFFASLHRRAVGFAGDTSGDFLILASAVRRC